MAASALAIALAALVLLPHGGFAIDATKERLIRREAFEVKESSGEVRIGSKGDMMRGERKRESNSLQPMETQHDVEGTTPSTHTDLCAKSFYNMNTDGVFTQAEDCHAPPYPSTGSDKRSLSETDCQTYATAKGQSTPITVFGQPLCGDSTFDDTVAIAMRFMQKQHRWVASSTMENTFSIRAKHRREMGRRPISPSLLLSANVRSIRREIKSLISQLMVHAQLVMKKWHHLLLELKLKKMPHMRLNVKMRSNVTRRLQQPAG
jgi:hypothetical protein